MSSKYPGGVISKTAPTPSGPYADSTAPGVWTLEQQAYWQKLGQWPTAGNVDPSAFIENLFSTYLYAGSNSATTITNGIDLSTKGGLVWTKGRTGSADNHLLIDTVRGVNKPLRSNETAAQYTETTLTAFNTTGYSITGANGDINLSGRNYVGWTFREQPKFFDIVTYTGTGVGGQTVAHNLGSTPGMVIIKVTSEVNDWWVWHRGLTAGNYIKLNTTAAQSTTNAVFFFGNGTTTVDPTSTVITLGGSGAVSGNGKTYVAYLFAHNAGGFGLTGTDNVISCGSYTGTGALNNQINIGYEPQFVIVKAASISGENWWMMDNMRGMPVQNSSGAVGLRPNTSDAEVSAFGFFPTATGFVPADTGGAINQSGATYIYIAIRRGPMKVPTTGTSVFTPQIATVSGSASNTVTTNFPVDLTITQVRNGYFAEWLDRLRGDSQSTYVRFRSANTSVEATGAFGLGFDNNTGYVDNYNWQNFGGGPFVYWNFRRAPSFFDIVSYTCNDQASAITSNHNLNVIPEMMIVKKRAAVGDWSVYHKDLNGGVTPQNYRIRLNATNAAGAASGVWNNTAPTSTQFTVGTDSDVNSGTGGALAYLFATCAGVSKVGSYTGTGAAQTINCGFTGGSRFVLIKRTDSTGDWYVWDSARGIIAGNDPYLLLNSTAAEVTGTDYVDTTSVGFDITSTAPAAINANGGTFIFLAIA